VDLLDGVIGSSTTMEEWKNGRMGEQCVVEREKRKKEYQLQQRSSLGWDTAASLGRAGPPSTDARSDRRVQALKKKTVTR
jgi:hypothetical protein